ncbi:DUF305 domain-containing protein [Rhodoglobus aureus]|uniref:DUF305 domain-containing protein n=1 Tax=Rhodoglobus aureus TaxID=191497 RepID=A0ABP4G6I1_9MICO
MKIRTTALISSALTATLLLAGCSAGTAPGGVNTGENSAPSSAESGSFNAADQMFAIMMIPHHQQAVEMADLVLEKADIDERVSELAQQIKAAQDPEISIMEGWLRGWGIDYDSSETSGMAGMGHGDGMMSDADMDDLQQAEGSEASRLFLEQMIEHHEGAIVMAQAQIDEGEFPAAIELATAIVSAQTEEIVTMQAILDTL